MGDTPLIPVRRGPWRLATIILLAGLAIMVALTFQSYGTTWDEEYHSVYGNAVLGWYRTFFQDRTALQYGDLYLYGGLFDALAQLATRVLPFGEYESRHLVGAALGLVGIAATWRLAALLAGERGGFIAAVILALTPPYWGHAFANPKDAPFAALSTLAIVAALSSARAVPRIPWRSAVEAGAAAGCAMGVRVVGILLLGWLALAWMGHLLARRPPEGWGRALAQLSLRYAAAVAVAWAIMLVGWPWAQLSPWLRPFQALRQLGHFQMVYDVLFDGRTWPSSALPPTYVPTWFALTLPETYFVGAMAGMAVVGLALAGRRGALAKAIDVGVIAGAALLLPIVAVIAGTNVYDGQRHFLFVMPLLAALAGAGLSSFLGTRAPWPLRVGIGAAAVVAAGVTALDAVRLHPYEYVYFNRGIAGGLRGAAGRYETDYWGATYREGAEWLLASYRSPPGRPIRVAILHVVGREGVPLLYVFDVRRPY